MISYEVWISNESIFQVSEVRTFQVDYREYESVRYLMFQNSLGGYDTVRCVGSPVESVAVQRQIVERFTDYDYLPTISEILINSVTGQRQISLNVGNWLTAEYRTYFEDLLISQEYYIVDNEEFIPLVPGFTDLVTHNVSEWPIERTLQFTYANPIGGFSRLPKFTAASRPTGWRQYSTSCELDANGIRTGNKIVNQIQKYYLDTGDTVRPLVTKPNVAGADGYIAPWPSEDCDSSSTPFKSVSLSKQSSFKRSNCSEGRVGSTWLVAVLSGTYGSEISQADADQKAAVALAALDTQANADLKGTCALAVNLKFGLINNCPYLGDGVFQPIPALVYEGVEIVPNHSETGSIRLADTDYPAGKYTLDVKIQFGGQPNAAYRIRIVSKNLASPVLTGNQTYRFPNVQVDWGDPTLLVSVEPA